MAIKKTLELHTNGILGVDNDMLVFEVEDTGELIPLHMVLSDFLEKPVKLSVIYDYE